MLVYLAGPDVFLAENVFVLESKAQILRDHGLTPLLPASSEVYGAQKIQRFNERQMHLADACLAEISPFRGVGMDAGTAYEIGFLKALGTPIVTYTNDRRDYVTRYYAQDIKDDPYVYIEDFGLPDNLMICADNETVFSFEEAVRELLYMKATA